MALVVKDRVQETSTTTGTGSLTLAGAVTGFQTFSSAIGDTNTTYYTIQNGAEWEVGVGTVSAGALSRDAVLESSNGGSLVNFSAGTKFVFCTYPAEKSVDIETAQTLTNKTISGSSNTLSNIANSSLTNSAITINGTSTSLGGSISVGTVTSVGGGDGLTGSVTSSGDLALGTPSTLTTSTTNAVTTDSHTHAVTFPVTSVNGLSGAVSVGTVTSIATSGGLTGGTITTSGTLSIADAGVTPAKLSQPSTLVASKASTSGTTVDFTGIPSWANKIILMLDGVSTNGTSNVIIQIGDSGGLETTGYLSYSVRLAGSSVSGGQNFTNGFGMGGSMAATYVLSGSVIISLLDSSTNTWVAQGQISESSAQNGYIVSGSKSLSATLDRITLTTSGGTNTFDAGKVSILYE
jgi:hypothetical protein